MKKISKWILSLLLLSTAFMSNEPVKVQALEMPVWITDKKEVEEYEYSFAVVGDTQIVSQDYPDAMHGMYKWILDNREEKNIQFVFGLGDITEGDADWEWENDKVAISQMDAANMPYSLIRGNHDTSAKFNRTFGYEEYTNQFLGFYKEGDLNSSYRTLTIGKENFLLVTLNYGPDDEELKWAGNVIERFPNHKVIITTHCYLDENANHIDNNHGVAPSIHNDDDKSPKKYNNGVEMWDKLISQYGNIVLVMSGHINSPTIPVSQSVGIHGNTVTELLINPQTEFDVYIEGGCAMVCMLYFNKDFSKIQVEYYSTIRDQYAVVQEEIDISKSGKIAHNLETKHNDYYHWDECDCGRKVVEELSEHSFAFDCSAICSNCTYSRGSSHTYDSIGYDETGHYKICSSCEEKDVSTIKEHIYDTDCDPTCNMCGYTRSVTHNLELHYKDITHHYDECSVCHSEANRIEHVYDNGCDSTCNTCGYERFVAHDYSKFIEEDKKTYKACSVCGDKKEIHVKKDNTLTIVIVCSVVGVGVIVGGVFLGIHLKKRKN